MKHGGSSKDFHASAAKHWKRVRCTGLFGLIFGHSFAYSWSYTLPFCRRCGAPHA